MSLKKDKITIGCIGCGNMGGAILQGLSRFTKLDLIGFDPHVDCLLALQKYGVIDAKNIPQLIEKSDIIIVAVKPALIDSVAKEMLAHLNKDKTIVSVAAGVTVQKLQNIFQAICPVIRCMPNTPASVGGGVFAFCCDDQLLTKKKKEAVLTVFNTIGTSIELAEHQFTAFSALIGAGPGYVFHIVNAMVQAGVTLGFSRKDSKLMVEGLCAGSIRMAQESECHLLDLRDQVCSPAGLTIEGINYMERKGISGHIVDALLAADKKARDMEKK